MPFAFSGNAMITMWPSGVTIGAGNQLFAFGDNAATTASMFIAANASGVTNATNTNFANGNAFYFSGFYLS
jgi:hypothetical protein